MGRLTYHIASGNEAKFAKIAAVVSVISEHQIVIIRHDDVMKGAAAASWRDAVLQDISLLAEQSLLASSSVAVVGQLECRSFFSRQSSIDSILPVDPQRVTVPTYPVSRQADDALHGQNIGVGCAEDDDI